jgi:DNA polymerase-3 subunit beta
VTAAKKKPAPAPDAEPASIEIDVQALRRALKGVVDVVEGRNTIPIMSNLLLAAEGGKLVLTGSDLDCWVDRTVDLAQPPKGEALRITVPAKLLAAVAAKLPAEALATLTLEGNKLAVSAGRTRFALSTLPADDFPLAIAPDGGWPHQFDLSAFDLQAMIDQVRFAISTEETRYYLNGVFLHAAETRLDDKTLLVLRAAATDGHRLARYELPQPDGAGALAGVIVARKTIGLIDKLLGEATEGMTVAVAISKAKVSFEIGDTSVTAKLIDGEFPDYTRVIPSANDKLVRVDPKALISAVERVAVIASEKVRVVKMTLDRDRIVLAVVSAEHGTATEELPCDYEGEALSVGFNARYLVETLQRIQSDCAELSLSDAAGPVLVRDTNADARGLFVIMPARI